MVTVNAHYHAYFNNYNGLKMYGIIFTSYILYSVQGVGSASKGVLLEFRYDELKLLRSK